MRIVQIIPGSGGSFYCGNCLRDSKYVEALRKQGQDVIKVPMYLPLFSDEHDLNEIPVFYGAVSLYLKQQYPIFSKAPKWIDKLLNSKPVLKLAASMAGSTNAKGLEDMTVSMLLGEEGKQKKELEQLIDWMEKYCRPDVVHISNALLLGLVHRIKERLNVPVICSLQDEDVWMEAMGEEPARKIWNLMHQKAMEVDAFISVSRYFAKKMIQLLNLPQEKVYTLHLGVAPDDYDFIPIGQKPNNIGYLSRMCHENGFHILVDAFIHLKKNPEFKEVKLIATGGFTGDDASYLKAIRKKLRKANLQHDVEFHQSFEGEGRKEFFKKVSVISVPVLKGEAFGIYLLESMASGIPVVQPPMGAFPEIIEQSKGGVIYDQNTPERLSLSLQHLLSKRNITEELSLAGRKGVETNFNIHSLTKEMIGIYQQTLTGKKKSASTVE